MVMDIEDLISPEEEWALVAVLQELAAAQTNHPDFVNAHEGRIYVVSLSRIGSS